MGAYFIESGSAKLPKVDGKDREKEVKFSDINLQTEEVGPVRLGTTEIRSP